MIPHVLLVSYNQRELASLQAKLSEMMSDYIVDGADSLRQGFAKVANFSPELVIMNFEGLSEVVLRHLRSMRSVAEGRPMLVLGPVDNEETLHSIASIPQTVVLEKPYDDRDLKGLSEKILSMGNAAQRVHRRYNTEQAASLEVYGKSLEADLTLYNLSRGGAYFELNELRDIVSGDLVKLQVELNDVQKSHRLHGKVVWTTPVGPSGGGFGIGVEFIQSSQLFRELSGR